MCEKNVYTFLKNVQFGENVDPSASFRMICERNKSVDTFIMTRQQFCGLINHCSIKRLLGLGGRKPSLIVEERFSKWLVDVYFPKAIKELKVV